MSCFALLRHLTAISKWILMRALFFSWQAFCKYLGYSHRSGIYFYKFVHNFVTIFFICNTWLKTNILTGSVKIICPISMSFLLRTLPFIYLIEFLTLWALRLFSSCSKINFCKFPHNFYWYLIGHVKITISSFHVDPAKNIGKFPLF